MNTRLGVVIDALVATWTAIPSATVTDGPPLATPDVGGLYIYVGWDGTDENTDAADDSQEWVGNGNRARNENLTVTCYAEHTTGDTVMKTARDAALALVQAAEDSLRADPQLDGALTGPSRAQFGGISRLSQPQTTAGARAGVVFTVTAFARL